MNAVARFVAMAVEVRDAGEADIDRLVELQIALFDEDAGRHDPNTDLTWPRREGRSDLTALLDGTESSLLVAEVEGVIVGFLAGYVHVASPVQAGARIAALRSLYVSPAHRRSSAASALVERFVEWARSRDCCQVDVMHYAANAGAAALYERLGFEPRSVLQVLPLDR